MFSPSKLRPHWSWRHVAVAGVLIATTTLVMAQLSFERDLAQLKEQRDQAKAAVVEPIERRYQAALEQLLRKATQGNDLETAVKVKEELEKFPSASDPRNTPLELIGIWEVTDTVTGGRAVREFKPSGKLVSTDPPGGHWVINGSKLIVTYTDPKEVDTFELPIHNHQLVGVSKLKHALTLIRRPNQGN
jgi:hypothetical protein